MAKNNSISAFRQHDARLLPAYSLREAARYLRVPVTTLRSWCAGAGGVAPVFRLDDPKQEFLSFMNVIEAHILAGIRHKYGVKLPQVRKALAYVKEQCGVARPLVEESFETNGHSLFIKRLGELINASKGGQVALPNLLPQLDRIEWDDLGRPLQLYPFTRPQEHSHVSSDPKIVVMNPHISFGRPSVRGIATSVIWERFRAGDSYAELAEDYRLDMEAIEEAIRCEAA
jgi:uncharacterized protein (DUF433 family)